MALVTEDGTGKSNADAYVSLAECDAYHTNLGNSDWVIYANCAANVTKRENAIKKATAFIDMRYGGRFKGVRKTAEQALLFPRYGISDNDGYVLENVPLAVKRATCEAALKIFLGADLMPDLDRGGKIISETVGPISTTYSSGAPAGTKFEMIESLLRGCLNGGSGVRMVRG